MVARNHFGRSSAACLFIIRIPGWRTFVVQPPSLLQLRESLSDLLPGVIRPSIFKAIEQGREADVLRLATPKRLQRARGKWGESPLAAVISAKRTELALQLIAREGSFADDGTLGRAARCGDATVIDALLAAGKNPDETEDDALHEGYTPLMWATNRNYHACMERLLAGGANVNAQAKDGTTAAMLTRSGDAAAIKALEILCQYKPDITIKDRRGRNLIREAIDRETNSEMPAMRILLERYYPDISFKP